MPFLEVSLERSGGRFYRCRNEALRGLRGRGSVVKNANRTFCYAQENCDMVYMDFCIKTFVVCYSKAVVKRNNYGEAF